jgi:hypothetical protein
VDLRLELQVLSLPLRPAAAESPAGSPRLPTPGEPVPTVSQILGHGKPSARWTCTPTPPTQAANLPASG